MSTVTAHTRVTGQVLEGRGTNQELVAENTESPEVDLGVVLLALDHLGGKVVERSAKRVTANVSEFRRGTTLNSPVAGGMDTPSKVGDLELTLQS